MGLSISDRSVFDCGVTTYDFEGQPRAVLEATAILVCPLVAHRRDEVV